MTLGIWQDFLLCLLYVPIHLRALNSSNRPFVSPEVFDNFAYEYEIVLYAVVDFLIFSHSSAP